MVKNIVDYLLNTTRILSDEGNWIFDIYELENRFGINFDEYIINNIIDELYKYEEVADVEVYNGVIDLLIFGNYFEDEE